MFLTKVEHSKIVKNFSNAFEKHQGNYADTYEPKSYFLIVSCAQLKHLWEEKLALLIEFVAQMALLL